MSENKYPYQPLSTIIGINQLPEQLNFLSESINEIFDKLYIKNYQVLSSHNFTENFYYVDLVCFTRLGFELPGTGMKLLINVDYSDQNVNSPSILPMSIRVNVPIKRFFAALSIDNLGSMSSYYMVLTQVLDISDAKITINTLDACGKDHIAFVDEINQKYNLSEPLDIGFTGNIDTDVPVIINEIGKNEELQDNDITLYDILFDICLSQLTDDEILSLLKQIFISVIPDGNILDYIKDLFIPKIDIQSRLWAGIEFPRSMLMPLTEIGGDPLPEPAKSVITFAEADVSFSTQTGFDFNSELSASLPPSQIGNTGLGIELNDLKFDFSRTSNIAEATAAGYPNDFVGVFVGSAEIGLPEKWFKKQDGAILGIYGENMLLGTGGISGTVGLKAIDTGNPPAEGDELQFKLGNGDKAMVLGFSYFDITFLQGAVTETNLKGSLTIPGVQDAQGGEFKLDITMHYEDTDNFSITAEEKEGYAISFGDFMTIAIQELEVGKEDDRFYVEIKGNIDFSDGVIGDYIKDPIEVKKLRVWEDGEIEFVGGGTLVLAKPLSLKLGPAKLSITALHFGTFEKPGEPLYTYVGFDGGVSVNPGGVDARGDGFKFNWNSNGDWFISIESIAIDLIIPGNVKPEKAAVLISGYLSLKDGGAEYGGGITFSLPKANLAGGAAMRMRPKDPAFIIDTFLELPVGIPLGPTGLAIYGFRGLFGKHFTTSLNYVDEQTPNKIETWYDYYKAKISPDQKEGVQVTKFDPEPHGFSIGAGISLASQPSGEKHAFTSKLFFMINAPSLLLIQGQAAIMKKRIGLDTTTDPPFFAMLAISKEYIMASFGASFKVPEDTGKILELEAEVGLGFFFKDPSAWYLNFGTDVKPVSGKLVKDILNINAYAYLMLSGKGIKTGGGISYELNKEFGPLSAELKAYIDMYAQINFKPVQAGAGLALGGSMNLSAFGVGLGLTAEASIAGEAPKPFIFGGSVKGCITILGEDYCAKFSFDWEKEKAYDPSEILIHRKGSGAGAETIMSHETYPIYCVEGDATTLPNPSAIGSKYYIPIDSKVNIEFLKPVNTLGLISNVTLGNSPQSTSEELVPFVKGKTTQMKHTFSVTKVQVKYWDNGWKDYDVFDAIEPSESDIHTSLNILTSLNKRVDGNWLQDGSGRVSKLSLLSRTPLEWTRTASILDLSDYNIDTDAELFCPQLQTDYICLNFDNYPSAREVFRRNFLYKHEFIKFYTPYSTAGISTLHNPFGLSKGFRIEPEGVMVINLEEPVALLQLRLLTTTDSVTISYYEKINGNDYDLITSVSPSPTRLSRAVSYNYSTYKKSVSRIVITTGVGSPGTCCSQSDRLYQQALVDKVEMETEAAQLQKEIDEHWDLYNDTRRSRFERLKYKFTAKRKESELSKLVRDIDNITDFINALAGVCYILKEEDGDHTSLEDETGALILERGSCRTPATDADGTYLFSICKIDKSVYIDDSDDSWIDEYNTTESLIQGLRENMEPTWRPNTKFLVQIATQDSISIGSIVPGAFTHYYNYMFQTAGPVGHFHNYDSKYKSLANKDEYLLSRLKHYIDYDKSYPNADGRLIGAKPLYYTGAKLSMYFTYAYVYRMFYNYPSYGGLSAMSAAMNILIKDPALTNDPGAPYAEVEWKKSTDTREGNDVRILNNMIKYGQNCFEVEPFNENSAKLEAVLFNLKPEKLYTAVFNSEFNGASAEVHSYTFQTSRYGCFRSQVFSYKLRPDDDTTNYCDTIEDTDESVIRYAYFDIELATDADLTKAVQVFNDTLPSTDSLYTEYGHRFDRLLNGALKAKSLSVPETTEFNMLCVTDEDGEVIRVVGILVRNPEPFNDPKIPDVDLEDTIKVLTALGNVDSNFKALISKDRSMAIITNNALDITDEELNIRFRFMEYDVRQNAFVYNPADQYEQEYYGFEPREALAENIRIEAPVTTLESTDGLIEEVDIQGTLQAVPVIGASAYEFMIIQYGSPAEEPIMYTRNNTDAILPLYELDGIEYNENYDIYVRPIITGRITKFGEKTEIYTKVVSLDIVLPDEATYQGLTAEIKVYAKDISNQLVTAYQGSDTLLVTGDAEVENAGVIEIINGVGKILVSNETAETVILTLLGDFASPQESEDLVFRDVIPTQFAISFTGKATQGEAKEITVTAIDDEGRRDPDFEGEVILEATGSAVVDGDCIVIISNGVGTIDVTDDVIETVTLSLYPIGSPSLDTSIEKTFEVIPAPAIEFVLTQEQESSPQEDTYQGMSAVIRVDAINEFGDIDTNYYGHVYLESTGNGIISQDGYVNIIQGTGSSEVNNETAETVTISLVDENIASPPEIDYSDTIYVEFLEVIATQYVIIEPEDTLQGQSTTITVVAQDDEGRRDPDYVGSVQLNATGDAVISNSGVVIFENGTGQVSVSDETTETVTITLTTIESPGLDDSDSKDVDFAEVIATQYVILQPQTGTQGESTTVTVEAQDDSGYRDPDYDGTVTLEATGSAVVDNAGAIIITNGTGTIGVSNDETESVTLSLTQAESPSLETESQRLLYYRPAAATQLVIIDPLDAGSPPVVEVTIQAQNDFGDIDTSYFGQITLEATGDAVVENEGVVYIENGVGVTTVTDDTVETVTLSLDGDTGSPPLDISSTQDVVFS